MADTDKTVAYGVSADASPFVKGMQDAADSAKNAASTIDDHFKKIQGAFSAVQKQLLLIAGIVAGGAFFKDAISASTQLTGETMKLSKMLGITGTEAGTLNTALKDIGSSGDDYVDVFTKFSKQLKNNEEGLKSLGLQTRDSNGNLRDSNTLFTEALQSVGQYKAGVDQNIYAQTVFGKSIDDVMKLQKLNNQVLEDAKKKNEDLGLTISKDNVAASNAYKLAMNDVGDVLLAVKKTIGDAVMPVFTELAQYFASTGPYVVAVFKGAMLVLIGAFDFVKAAVKTVAGVVSEAISLIIDGAGLLGDVFSKLFKGDFSGAYESAKQVGVRMAQAVSGAFANFVEAGNDVDGAMKKNYDRLYGDGGGEVGKPKSGDKKMAEKPAAGADKSSTSKWEAELAEDKLAYQEKMNLQGSFSQYSKEDEAAFWAEKLELTTEGSADNLAVRSKAADLQLAMGQAAYQDELAKLQTREASYKTDMNAKLAILDQEVSLVAQHYGTESKEYEAVQKKIVEAKRTATEQLKQIDLMRAQAERDAGMSELQGRQQIAQLELQLGTITQAQMLDKQRQFENDKAAIQLAGLKEREAIALADPDRNLIEIERIHQEIEQAERQHQLALSNIRMQATMQSQQYTLNATNAMGAGFQGVFAKAMQGSLSLRGVMQGLWQSMTQAVTNMLASMAAQWLMTQMKNMIFGKVVAESNITASAAAAGAGGVASMAAAPWPLDMGAVEFGAAMAGAAMSFAPMAAASGGYDIPGSINPIVQAHAREMILPAKHADVIRNMADGGQGNGGGGDIHIHGSPSDSIQLKDLPAVLKKLNRNFHFVS